MSVLHILHRGNVSWPWGLALAAVVIKLDHGAKQLFLNWLGWHGIAPAVPGVFQWHVVKNTGAAWSILAQQPDVLRWGSGLLIVGIVAMAARQKHPAMWLVVGAALSNWWDRWQYQGVVDYVELTCIHYPIFNLADMVIVGCAIWLAWSFWRPQPLH
jgi:signal peptidase II